MEQLGFPIESPEITALSTACRAHLAYMRPGIADSWADLKRAIDSNAVCYARVVDPRGWYQRSFLPDLFQSTQLVHGIARLSDLKPDTFQRKLYLRLHARPLSEPSPFEGLHYRLRG
eukprot:3801607-Pyramimonas_sp.AAC.1